MTDIINTMHDLNTIVVDVTPILPGGENGGAKIFVLELLKRLAELAPKTQFILLTQAASHDELKLLECENIKCKKVLGESVRISSGYRWLASLIHLPFLTNRLSYLGYRLIRFLKRRKASSVLQQLNADLLFCPFTAPTYFESKIPMVCTLYDLQYKTYPEFFTREEAAHRHHTFNEACRQASLLAAISDYSRESAIQHGGLSPEKIRRIYLQMAQRILPDEAQDKQLLAQLGLVSQKYILYPANFWKHKNHEMLLTAFKIACEGDLPASIKLVCTGAKGERLDWLVQATRLMGLGDRVSFPGYLKNNELAVLLANSNGVIFPSLYEGFGLPVIEAMAAGIPVACSNQASLPEIVADAALLFNPRIPTQIATAIITLQNDSIVRERLINAGRARAKAFSASQEMAKEYWHLFQDALCVKKQGDNLSGNYNDKVHKLVTEKKAG